MQLISDDEYKVLQAALAILYKYEEKTQAHWWPDRIRDLPFTNENAIAFETWRNVERAAMWLRGAIDALTVQELEPVYLAGDVTFAPTESEE